MVEVNMSAYGAAIEVAILNPVDALYTNNGSAPLQAKAGVRQTYEFGLYSYCAFVQDGTGICGNHTIGEQFRPFDTITADMLSNYSVLSAAFIQNPTFRDSKYLGQLSETSYWMFLLGTICAALTVLTSVSPSTHTFEPDSWFWQRNIEKQFDIFCLFLVCCFRECSSLDRSKYMDSDD